MNESKGRIPRDDINIIFTFSTRMEEICAHLGFTCLERQAKTVQRIAHAALYDANYEARRQRVCRDAEEYPFVVDEEDSEPNEEVARFMRRSADDDDNERF